MTATLTLTDGTTTINLMDGTNYAVQENGFAKPMPKRSYSFGGGGLLRDGSDLIDDTYENREVTINLNVYATSADNLDQRIQDILVLIETARSWAKTRRGSAVELQYKKDGATDTTYFDVLDGTVEEPDTTHSVLLKSNTILGVVVKLTCKPFARGALTSCLAATTVYNHDDTDHDNFVDIASGSVKGDVRGSLKLWIHNNTGSSYEGLRIAVQSSASANLVSHVLEAEAEHSFETSASEVADATCSGSLKVRIGSGSFAESVVATYNLTQNLTEELAGWYRAFGRMYAAPAASDAGFRCKWDWASGDWWTSASQGCAAACTWEMIDLGLVKFPPFAVQDTWVSDSVMADSSQRRFDLYTHLTSSSATLEIDYFEFFPMFYGIAIGGSTGMSASTGQLFDSVSEPPFTARTGSSGSLVQVVADADWVWTPLYVEPGKANRVIVSIDRDSACNVTLDNVSISGSYVPRYLLVK